MAPWSLSAEEWRRRPLAIHNRLHGMPCAPDRFSLSMGYPTMFRPHLHRTIRSLSRRRERLNGAPSALLLLSLLLVSPAAGQAQSPFYVTVERTVSDREPARIRLDYADTSAPVLLRILKPKSLDSYLEGQFSVSRSYETPVTVPSLYTLLARGVSKGINPVSRARRSLAPEFRRQLSTVLSPPLVPFSSEPLPAGPQFRYSAPENFELVKQTYLTPEVIGAKNSDTWWWFESTPSAGGGSYRSKTVLVDPLPAGIYAVQVIQGDHETQSLMQVSSISVQVEQSSREIVVRVIDRDGKPLSGANVRLRPTTGGIWETFSQVTSEDGELVLSRDPSRDPFPQKLLVLVNHPTHGIALTGSDFIPSEVPAQDTFIFTDRPIIKPGEQVQVGGIVRTLKDGTLSIGTKPGKGSLTLDGPGAGGEPVKVDLSPEGSFSGLLQLPPSLFPGLYRVRATFEEASYSGEFRVQDYVKPTFFLSLKDRPATIIAGQPLTLSFNANRYRGGAVPGVKYEVFLYRKRFDTPKFVEDSGATLSTGSDYYGSSQSTAALAQPERIYSTVDVRAQADTTGAVAINPWASSPTADDAGTGTITIPIPPLSERPNTPQEWIYSLVIRAQDSEGSQATISESFYVTKSSGYASVQFPSSTISSDIPSVKAEVHSTTAQGTPLPHATGEIRCTLESSMEPEHKVLTIPFLTDESGKATVAIPLTHATIGSMRAFAKVTELRGTRNPFPVESDPAQILVKGNPGERLVSTKTLELVQGKGILSPDETDTIVALLPDDTSLGADYRGWVSVVSSKILETTPLSLMNPTAEIPFTARGGYGSAAYVTVSIPRPGGHFEHRTVAYRIAQKEKILSIGVLPSQDVAAPLETTRVTVRVTDSSGRPVKHAETFSSVVDDAVYAVQPEFRPSLMDFFLPLTRQNVARFLSDELQGYGYAAALFRANYKLHDLKNSNQPRDKLMRDTAGFFPHRFTDEKGEVVLEVPMPSNITKWRVTTLATTVDGKLGEGKAFFNTRSDLGITLQMPQFLRTNDSVEGSAALDNLTQSGAGIKGEVRYAAGSGLSLYEDSRVQQFSIDAGKSVINSLQTTAAAGTGVGAIRVSVNVPDPQIKIGGARDYDVSLLSNLATLSENTPFKGSGLTLNLPHTVDSLSVVAVPGIVQAVDIAKKGLLEYPYGCTEQLLATTIPNLLAIGSASDADARRRSADGLRKLVQHQASNGGFAMYSGQEPSPELTAYVYVSLAGVKDSDSLDSSEVDRLLSAIFQGAQNYLRQTLQTVTTPTPTEAEAVALIGPSLFDTGQSTHGEQMLASYISATMSAPPAESDLVLLSRIVRRWSGYMPSNLGALPPLAEIKAFILQGLHAAAKEKTSETSIDVPTGYSLPWWSSGAHRSASLLAELHAWQQLSPTEETLLITRILDQYQSEDGWGSTYETSQVIAALRSYVASQGAKQQNLCSRPLLLHVAEQTAPCSCTQDTARCSLTREQLASVGTAPVAVSISQLPPTYRAYAQINRSVTADQADQITSGIDIKRQLFRVLGSGAAEPITPETMLRVGDQVISMITVTNPEQIRRSLRLSGRSLLYVLHDPIPSLAVGVEDERLTLADAGMSVGGSADWTITETRRYPTAIDRVYQQRGWRQSGQYVFYNAWRVRFPGKAALPPATITDMYNSERTGFSTGSVSEVTASK
jgi:hypothetical protein